jgi:putative intracellular protease/amidase
VIPRDASNLHRWRAIGALLVLGIASVTQALAGDVSKIDRYQPRFGREQPVIAVVGENAATELTDFVIPYGILSESGAADVHAVATGAGAITMWPALTLQPDMTLAIFDERFPEGADYVVVPAVMSMDKKTSHVLVDWIRAQADKGATIVSICDGALTVAAAGVFKGRRATGHWATFERRKHDFPDTEWLENTRYVADGKAISSAGVSASIPVSLALVEAIAGTERAQQVTRNLGLNDWSSTHDSEQFDLGFGGYSLAIGNWLLPSTKIGIAVADGVDEIALALAADAYSRTYRSRAYSVADTSEAVRTRRGLALMPDRIVGKDKLPRRMQTLTAESPLQSLDHALAGIEGMFGARTARFVALQMEYPR